jgi:uncharacterized DUF497 family protein
MLQKSLAALFNRMYDKTSSSIEFDPEKSSKNLRERGIWFERFADVELDTAIVVEDARQDYGERRIRVFGHIGGQLHVAVITPRGDRVRVISLRRANEREERAYAKERQSP